MFNIVRGKDPHILLEGLGKDWVGDLAGHLPVCAAMSDLDIIMLLSQQRLRPTGPLLKD